MRIGILGSGLMGSKLGTIFALSGHEVMFGYSHSRAKLEDLARKAGNGARAGTPAEVAREADTLLLSVHWSRVDDVLTQAGDLSGKTVITCSLPMSEDDSHMIVGLTSSGAEALAEKVPDAHVVSAFSTAPSEVMFAVHAAKGGAEAPDLVYCGDDRAAKAKAARLIGDVGFNPIDAGQLSTARLIEPYSILVAQLAYERLENPALGYRLLSFVEREHPGAPGEA